MAEVSSARKNNFDILQDGIFNLYVDDNLDLFDRQATSITKLCDAPRNDYSYASGYFHLCTAFGKSYLIKAMAMSYNAMQSGKKIIVLEENQSVVKQMARELTINSSLESRDVGMFYAESKDVDTPIIVCTYASMKKMIERVGRENIGLVLCDEAHHILSENRQNVAREFADCALYGFTATSDYGEVDKNCATVFGPVIDSVTIRDGIERDGLLCSTKTGLFLSNIPVDLTRAVAPGHEDYDPAILDELLRASHVDGLRRGLADWYLYGVDDTLGTVFGKPTIINVPSIAEAERVAREFNTAAAERGVAPIARAYHTKSPDMVLDEFNAGRFPVLVQVNKLSEGYNNPHVAICINYPTHSLVRSVQCSGRALRFDPNNPNKCALVMDVAFARRAADEGDGDAVSAIYENGQRLFYESMGIVKCLNPNDARTRGDVPANMESRPREHVALPSVFRVITSVEFTNMVLEHRANNLDVEIKTDEWLSANDLAGKYIHGMAGKIRRLLKQYQNQMPNDIQIRSYRGNITHVLHRDAIDRFCEISGSLRVDHTIGPKTSEWISAHDLMGKYVSGDETVVRNALKKYQSIIPEYIQKKVNGGRVSLYLRQDGVNKFCDIAGLTPYREMDDKTPGWLTAGELESKYIVGSAQKIALALKQYADEMPNDIQQRRNKARTPLCLNVRAIDRFCSLSGLQRVNTEMGDKTDEWLNAKELVGKYIGGDINVIRKNLEKYSTDLSEYIQIRRNNTVPVICLHRDGIKRFCKISGMTFVDNSIGDKTDEWLSTFDLYKNKYIKQDSTRIIKELRKYQRAYPEYIQVRRNAWGSNVLCVRRDFIDDFCKIAGLDRFDNTIGKKTSEWLTANDLKGKYIEGSDVKILWAIKECQSKMPGDIQLKNNRGKTALCVNRDAIDKFCEMSGLKRISIFIDKTSIGVKTEEWLGPKELNTFLAHSVDIILRALRQYQSQMPNDIQFKRSYNHKSLHLRRDAIDDFCKLSGLRRRQPFMRPDNTNDR